MAFGAGPTYSAAGIVNASDYSTGPFAPNSVLSVFGSGLARSTYILGGSDIKGGILPFELNYARVYIQDQPVPLLFVSATQINFLVPTNLSVGPVRVRVVTEGVTGPEVVITLIESAPALFTINGGYAIATTAAGKLLTSDNPARSGDIIVIYATGLGRTSPNPITGEIPSYTGQMVAMPSLKVTLAGKPVDPMFVKYAGISPGSAGLYQINLEVPPGTDSDPQIVVSAGAAPDPTAFKLAIQ